MEYVFNNSISDVNTTLRETVNSNSVALKDLQQSYTLPMSNVTSESESSSVEITSTQPSVGHLCCALVHDCRICRKIVRWNRSKIHNAEDDLNLNSVCLN